MEKLSLIPLMIIYTIYNNNKRANHAGNKHYEGPIFLDGKGPGSIFLYVTLVVWVVFLLGYIIL